MKQTFFPKAVSLSKIFKGIIKKKEIISFNHIPEDILLHKIFNQYLTYPEVSTLSCVNKYLTKIKGLSSPNDLQTKITDPVKWSKCFPSADSFCLYRYFESSWTDYGEVVFNKEEIKQFLKKIKKMKIISCDVTSFFLHELSPQLTYLEIAGPFPEIPPYDSCIMKLIHIDGSVFRRFQHLQTLIVLGDVHISNFNAQDLSPHLIKIQINTYPVEMKGLSKLKGLKSVDIFPYVNEAELLPSDYLSHYRPTVDRITLRNMIQNEKCPSDFFKYISPYVKGLELPHSFLLDMDNRSEEFIYLKYIHSFRVVREYQLLGNGFHYLANLLELILIDCPSITSENLICLTRLYKLTLDFTCYLTIQEILNDRKGDGYNDDIFIYLTNLTELSIMNNFFITSKAFKYLSKLERLNITCCYHLSPYILNDLPLLNYLEIGVCLGPDLNEKFLNYYNQKTKDSNNTVSKSLSIHPYRNPMEYGW